MDPSIGIEIREFSPEFQQNVLDLIVGIQQREFGIPITAEDQPDLMEIPSFYQKRGGNFWVARINGTLAGTISLLNIGNQQAALRKMFVDVRFRGPERGVAALLLHTLLDWAARRDFAEIFLGTTPKFLAAHRFYDKNGFIQVPKESLPPAFPIMTVDTRFYKYTL